MPSPFASLITSDPIPLPFDSEHWITVRKLTGRQYEEAQTRHRLGVVNGDRWAGFFRTAVERGPTSKEAALILADPLTGYDRYALVRLGLVAWSYSTSLEAIEELDDEAIDFIAREVLRLTKPALFQTPEQQETEQKNAVGSFTAV